MDERRDFTHYRRRLGTKEDSPYLSAKIDPGLLQINIESPRDQFCKMCRFATHSLTVDETRLLRDTLTELLGLEESLSAD